MEKKMIILKTHGLRNSREAGLVVLPTSFYVKVDVSENGDFEVEFFDSMEEQLFSACYSVESLISRTPSEEELQAAGRRLSHHIVDTLAEYLLDDTRATFDTEAHWSEWAALIGPIFYTANEN